MKKLLVSVCWSGLALTKFWIGLACLGMADILPLTKCWTGLACLGMADILPLTKCWNGLACLGMADILPLTKLFGVYSETECCLTCTGRQHGL